MASEKTCKLMARAEPFAAVVFLQFGLAGMDLLSKVALNEGTSNYVFVVYRHAISTAVMCLLFMLELRRARLITFESNSVHSVATASEDVEMAVTTERGGERSATADNRQGSHFQKGVFCSGLAYYIQGIVMKERGPVFVTSFSPLSMVIVAVLSSFILREILYLGRLVGAMIIVAGLYLVVWGKRKDHKSSTVEVRGTDEEMTNANSKRMENLIHEVMKIDMPSFSATLERRSIPASPNCRKTTAANGFALAISS